VTFHITKIYPKHRRSIPRLKEEHRKDEAVKREIVFLWVCFDQMCGKRLVGTLSDILSMLLQRGRINGDQEVLQKLLHISAAMETILTAVLPSR